MIESVGFCSAVFSRFITWDTALTHVQVTCTSRAKRAGRVCATRAPGVPKCTTRTARTSALGAAVAKIISAQVIWLETMDLSSEPTATLENSGVAAAGYPPITAKARAPARLERTIEQHWPARHERHAPLQPLPAPHQQSSGRTAYTTCSSCRSPRASPSSSSTPSPAPLISKESALDSTLDHGYCARECRTLIYRLPFSRWRLP